VIARLDRAIRFCPFGGASDRTIVTSRLPDVVRVWKSAHTDPIMIRVARRADAGSRRKSE
jgi:hypothetical protein